MKIEEQVTAWVEEKIAGTGLFIVELRMLPKNRLLILIDGDKGVTIEQCAEISRYIGHKLEEADLISNAYLLDVSSPGIDHPLRLKRQYVKNIGREVQVLLADGMKKQGRLLAVNEQDITIEETVKEKGKKPQPVVTSLLFDIIKETKVQVSFK